MLRLIPLAVTLMIPLQAMAQPAAAPRTADEINRDADRRNRQTDAQNQAIDAQNRAIDAANRRGSAADRAAAQAERDRLVDMKRMEDENRAQMQDQQRRVMDGPGGGY